MKFDDPSMETVKPTMTHFFYMDEADPSKVSRWVGSVGPTGSSAIKRWSAVRPRTSSPGPSTYR